MSYDAENHEKMVNIRAEKVKRIADEIPPTKIFGAQEGDLLVLGWGGTFGTIRTVVENKLEEGHAIGHAHLRHLNPFPSDLGEILKRFKTVLIPELNSGQLRQLIRNEFLVDAIGLNKVQGQPFQVFELESKIETYI